MHKVDPSKPLNTPSVTTRHVTSDGVEHFVKIWGDPESAKGCILLVHGLGEHIERYEHVAQSAYKRNICMIGFDQRGHGKTPGKRGVILNSKRFMADLQEMLDYAQSHCSGKPVFIYGHSMGSLEVLYFSLTAQPKVAGVIATSPPLDTATTSKSQKILVGILKGILPNLTISSKLGANLLSRDPKVVSAYQNDPLVHDQVSVALGAFLIDCAEFVLDHAPEWRLPLFLAHGSDDAICPIAGSKAFVKNLPKDANLTFKIWEGAYHETHNDLDKATAITSLLDWVESQL